MTSIGMNEAIGLVTNLLMLEKKSDYTVTLKMINQYLEEIHPYILTSAILSLATSGIMISSRRNNVSWNDIINHIDDEVISKLEDDLTKENQDHDDIMTLLVYRMANMDNQINVYEYINKINDTLAVRYDLNRFLLTCSAIAAVIMSDASRAINMEIDDFMPLIALSINKVKD